MGQSRHGLCFADNEDGVVRMLNLMFKPILVVAALAFMTTACQKKASRSNAKPKEAYQARGQGGGGGGQPDSGAAKPTSPNNGKQDDGSRFAGTGKRPGGPSVEEAPIDPSTIETSSVSTTPGLERNAAFGDYLWNPPGTPFPIAATPILTGGMTEREYRATDANDDFLMKYLAQLSEEDTQKDKEFGDNSLKLAKAISNISAIINRTNGNVDINFVIKSGPRDYIIPFRGRLTANRRVVLDNVIESTTYEEIDRKKEKQYKERKFRLTLACVDKTTGCSSVIMRLDQLFLKEGVVRSKDTKESDWQICRSVYSLARKGNVHLQIDEEDYKNFESYRGINDNHYQFMKLLANSAHYVRYKTKSFDPKERKHLQGPRLHNATMEFFAVLYGYAGFQVNLHSAAPINSPKVLVDGITQIRGPMLYAESRIANDNDMYPFFTNVLADATNYASMIETAKLVENDGRGQMAIVLNFKGEPEMSTQVNFTTLFDETINPFEQRGLKEQQSSEGEPRQTVPMPPRELKLDK